MTDTYPHVDKVYVDPDETVQARLVVGGRPVPFPACEANAPGECRLDPGPVSSTGQPRHPVYDRWGNDLSVDPNTYTCRLDCKACGAFWILKVAGGESAVERIRAGKPNFPLAKAERVA